MTTFSNGSTSFEPDTVLGYASSSEHGNLVHRRLGSELVDVTLRPASLRSSSQPLELQFDDGTAAYAAEAALRGAHVWTMTAPGVDTIDMQFVVHGTVERRLDATGAAWVVTFGWQEVLP